MFNDIVRFSTRRSLSKTNPKQKVILDTLTTRVQQQNEPVHNDQSIFIQT